jgi:ectoine hydroxylase-related dioxygenase (phytanoyl-CoA dioxygenase family)
MRSAIPRAFRIAGCEDEIHEYRDRGYAILDAAFAMDEVNALRDEALRICRGDRCPVAGLEPAKASEPDDAVLRRTLCVHFPHKLSALAMDAMRHPGVVSVLTEVIGPDVKAMQSMLFIKAEGKPGQAWHQDEYFIPTRDRSLTAAWIALDDATVDNGCLWVLPGSHSAGILYPDREHDDARFDCTVESYDFPYRDDQAVPVEVPAGSVVIFNGYLLHRSLPNNCRRGMRRALVNHYMSAQSLLPWLDAARHDHAGKADHRDVVLVAGTDPYAYKGTHDIVTPQVRSDRDGGCRRGEPSG